MLRFGLFSVCVGQLANEMGYVAPLLPSFGICWLLLIWMLVGFDPLERSALPLENVSKFRRFPAGLQMPVYRPANP